MPKINLIVLLYQKQSWGRGLGLTPLDCLIYIKENKKTKTALIVVEQKIYSHEYETQT